MEKESRWKCDCCDHIFIDSEFLTAPSPFRDDDVLVACPKCKLTEGFTELCELCYQPATCGTPTRDGYFDSESYSNGKFDANGYMRTCGKHVPKEKKT